MTEFFETATTAVEAAGALLLLVGLTYSTGRFLFRVLRGPRDASAYRTFRKELGGTLLLTLEFLIAADIIETIAVEMTLESLGMLGLLVLIRTFLSFALEMELSGRWPWQGREETPAADG